MATAAPSSNISVGGQSACQPVDDVLPAGTLLDEVAVEQPPTNYWPQPS